MNISEKVITVGILKMNSDGSITITATPRNDFMSFVSQFSYIQKRINSLFKALYD